MQGQQTSQAQMGKVLVAMGALTEDQLRQALQSHLRRGGFFGDTLVSLGFVPEDLAMRVYAKIEGLSYISFDDIYLDSQNSTMLPEAVAKRYRVVPVQNGESLVIASEHALPQELVKTLERLVKKPVTICLANKKDIAEGLARVYTAGMSLDFAENTTASMVDKLLQKAVHLGASDIHIEAHESMVNVRFRMDGMLQQIAQFPPESLPVIASRIKVLAGLNIAERRSPQDGSFTYTGSTQDSHTNGNVHERIDIRVSCLPCIHGEKIVLRLLTSGKKYLTLHELGLSERDEACFQELINRPHGIVLIVGPTGSGKSTTLCAVLNAINSPHVNITTVEDPVEYKIDGVNQVQIHSGEKISFASALRSILRQDPDIIMVGETRDTETASIALRASLTGHLVFTTLHTNDTSGALPRLMDMGCEPFLVGASVSGVLAQRLIRRLCPKCKQAYEPSTAECAELGLESVNAGPWYRAKGCQFCANTGYKGRIGIFELLIVDENIRRAMLQGKNAHVISFAARASGMTSLRADGIHKIQQGITSVTEVLRATVKG